MRAVLQRQGGELVAIAAEKPDSFFEAAKRHAALPCVLACDPNADAAAKLHLLQANMARVGKRLAIPANILVDSRGIVRWVHFAHLVMDRPDPKRVLEQVEKLIQF